MSFAFFRQWRRPLVLGTLIVLLHWMVLGWITAGTQGLGLPGQGGEALVSLTRLLPPAAVAPPEPVPPPEPRMAQPELPDFDPLPSDVVVADAVGERLPSLAAPPDAALPAAVLSDSPVVPGALDEADAVAAADPAPASAPVAPSDPVRLYKVDVPPPADITLDVARLDADGTRWSGQAILSWKHDQAGAYRVRIEAGIRIVFARVNLVVLTSEGQLGGAGLAPVKMTEKRRGRALTATHFDWPENKLTFSGSQASYTLQPGAQDKATVPLQLAAIARGDPAQLDGEIDMFVGEDRDGSVYSFQPAGREEIDTPMGRLQTVRLTRPPKPGSYRSRLDIWLAPAHGWMPVQIRSSEANGAVTTQTVNNIAMTPTGF